MSDSLTDVEHWASYWSEFVPRAFTGHKLDPLFDQLPDGLSALEIGGFPGQISAYLNRKKGFDVSIVDFYMDPDLVEQTEDAFALEHGTIQCTKADFFSHGIERRYDLVHSHGFIEHFEDPSDILARHLELVRDGGHVLVSMPNLRGNLYGWVVERYDRPLFDTHNLRVMDPEVLAACCEDLQVQGHKVEFLGPPGGFWIPDNTGPKVQIRALRLLSGALRRAFPNARNQRLSPTIGLLIQK